MVRLTDRPDMTVTVYWDVKQQNKQTDWIQIRPDNLSGLIWVQTVCKSYQQITLGVMHQSFVSTAPPPTGMGGDSDFHFSEPCYKPRPVGTI